MKGRSIRQIRERYYNYLAPNLNNVKWTYEEDILLEEKVKEIGHQWKKISEFFVGRSAVNLKNRFISISHQRALALKNQQIINH
jgi:hypothetical protein